MNIVDINNPLYPFKIILRRNTFVAPNLFIINEESKEVFSELVTITVADGIATVENIDFVDYVKGNRYSIYIKDSDDYILYRGKILCLDSTETQNIKQSTDYFVYE